MLTKPLTERIVIDALRFFLHLVLFRWLRDGRISRIDYKEPIPFRIQKIAIAHSIDHIGKSGPFSSCKCKGVNLIPIDCTGILSFLYLNVSVVETVKPLSQKSNRRAFYLPIRRLCTAAMCDINFNYIAAKHRGNRLL